MNRRKLLGAGLAVLAGSRPGSARAPASGPGTGQVGRDKLLSVAREIMKGARYCALITQDSAGRARARAMDAFPPEDDMTVWFGTNPSSRKVREIQRDPRVTLYYFDPQVQGYVTLLGAARLVSEQAAKKTHWKEEWKQFYPDRDRGYLLIAVAPELIEVVSPKHGVEGNSAAWAPPAIQVAPAARKP